MSKHTPISAPLLRKLQAFCCVPGALKLDKIEALLQTAKDAGFKAANGDAIQRFLTAESGSVEVMLASDGGREIGVLHLAAKDGAVHTLAFAQAVARIQGFAAGASEAPQVTRQLSYGLGNPTLAFDDVQRVSGLTPDQVTEDVLVSLQSWFPKSSISERVASLKDYEKAKAPVTGGLELRVVIAPVIEDGVSASTASLFDIVVMAGPVG